MELGRIQTPAGRKAFIFAQEGDKYTLTIFNGKAGGTILTLDDKEELRSHWTDTLKNHPTWHRLVPTKTKPRPEPKVKSVKHSSEEMAQIKKHMVSALSKGIRSDKVAWKYAFAKFKGQSFDGSQYGIAELTLS
tara:strand:- start:409 stop:810 length:402 start_codon:yes stop_codon:yes gene_type:complete